MTKIWEYPEELRLIWEEPVEDNGWGEFRFEWERAPIVINNMAEFIMYHHCLLAPALDIDKHIATLVKKCECPVGEERDIFRCPCPKADNEIEKDGHTSCGVFVTERYLQQGQHADRLPTCKEKTRALLERYKMAQVGMLWLSYYGFQVKHLAVLQEKAKTTRYWARAWDFVLELIPIENLTASQVRRLERIKRSLEK